MNEILSAIPHAENSEFYATFTDDEISEYAEGLQDFYDYVGDDESLKDIIDADSFVGRFIVSNLGEMIDSIHRFREDKRDDGTKVADNTLNSAVVKLVNELTWRGKLAEAKYLLEMNVDTPRIKPKAFNDALKDYYCKELLTQGYDLGRSQEVVEVLLKLATVRLIIRSLSKHPEKIRDLSVAITSHNLYTSHIKTKDVR